MARNWRTVVLACLVLGAVLGVETGNAATVRLKPDTTYGPAIQSQAAPGGPANKLIVYGDTAMFTPPGTPENCILRSRFHRGDPIGWRMFVADPQTGNRE